MKLTRDMSYTEFYTYLLCASSKDHIVKEPINLACSHGVCKSCFPKGSDTIVCKICETEQKINNNKNIFITKLLKMNLHELFNKLEKQMSDQIIKLKGISIFIWDSKLIHFIFLDALEDRDNKLEATMVFIEGEIEIRIQSLKDELDNLFEEFKKEVKSHKEELKR